MMYVGYMQGALEEIGIQAAKDFNTGSLLGAQYCATTIDPARETRESSQTSFLNAAVTKGFSNLKVFHLSRPKRFCSKTEEQSESSLIQIPSYTPSVLAKKLSYLQVPSSHRSSSWYQELGQPSSYSSSIFR